MKIKKLLILISAISICQMAGIIGTFFTISAIPTWYITLTKPSFSPPNWLFGPVWTILYTLMGISVYKIWIKTKENKDSWFTIKIFAVHLLLNSIWSILFFGMRNPQLAFFNIVAMDVTLIYIIFIFHKIDKQASLLLIPYLLWILFATVLNYSIWLLN